jgi:hypothetical protein
VGVADSAACDAADRTRRANHRFTLCAGAPCRTARLPLSAKNRVRGKTELLSRIRLIWPVQSRAQKYSYFVLSEIVHDRRIPCPLEGRNRDRHERWTRGAMAVACRSVSHTDGRQAADAEMVWSWHPDADAKLMAMIRQRRGQSSRSPRRAPIKRSPSRREGRDVLPNLWFLPRAFFRTGAMGAASSRPSLRPPCYVEGGPAASLGRSAPRDCGGASACLFDG